MSTKRDTQFTGFAKAVWAELEANINFIPESTKHRKTFLPIVEGIIARRAYDLVEHVLETIQSDEWQWADERTENTEEIIKALPDMSELPQVD